MERNHNVKVGDVFYDTSYDPDWGSSVRFVQITALRGKCTAEYRFIRKECRIKAAEIGSNGVSAVPVFPLRDQFFEEGGAMRGRLEANLMGSFSLLSKGGGCYRLPYSEGLDLEDTGAAASYPYWHVEHGSIRELPDISIRIV